MSVDVLQHLGNLIEQTMLCEVALSLPGLLNIFIYSECRVSASDQTDILFQTKPVGDKEH